VAGTVTNLILRGTRYRRLWRLAALGILALTFRSAPAGAQMPGALNVSLTASPTTVTEGRSVTFEFSASPPSVRDARLTSVVIDYGDGASSNVRGPFEVGERVTRTRDHAYTAAGDYTATVTATASNGESNNASQTIHVNGHEQPIGGLDVSLTASPTDASAGQVISFNLSASPPSVPGGKIDSMSLDFGDGSSVNVLGPFAAGERVMRTRDHTYTHSGDYTATLTVTASNGETKSAVQTVHVTGDQQIGGLTVNLTASPTTAATGQLVTFNISASPPSVLGGSISSLVIAFGDGAQDSLPGPFAAGEQVTRTRDHDYLTPGGFTASVTATASNGETKTASQTITVAGNQPPGGLTVNLTASPTSASTGQLVTFNASASPPSVLGGQITIMSLDFGDGATADLGNGAPGEQVTRTTTHSYATGGTYTATLTATASNGAGGGSNQTITVSGGAQPPVGGLTVNLVAAPSTVQAGQLVTFNGSASPPSVLGGSITSITLDFGDGITTDLGNGRPGQTVTPSTTHSYAAPGTYVAIITATASNGETNDASQTIFVIGSPSPAPIPGGMPINYAAGWNIVTGPAKTMVTGNLGPLYTYQPGNLNYQSLSNGALLTAGQGYWAYFDAPTSSSIPFVGPQTISVNLPARQWVMVGNPGSTTATVAGADIVYTYAAGPGYQTATTLLPGQGAWAISLNGGIATISNP
jgi:PKD repeat protein